MSTHGTVATTEPTGHRRVPEAIDSSEAKLVYHSLDAVGAGSVDELADRLCLKKLTLYGVLAGLDRRGLVEKRGNSYVATRNT